MVKSIKYQIIFCALAALAFTCTLITATASSSGDDYDVLYAYEEYVEVEVELEFLDDDEDATTPFPDDGYNCTTNGFFAHPVYCEYYYQCVGGLDTLLKCSEQYLFDLVYNGCNYPELTDCQDRERPEGYPTNKPPTGTSSTTDSPGYQCPDENGNYPDELDCSSYWQCFEGNPYHFKCPFPLMFDIEMQVCNHPGSVDCGSRPKP